MSGRGIVWERVCNNSRERLRQDGMIAWCRMHPPVLKVGKGRSSKRGSFLAVRTGKGPPDWVCVANGLSILGDDKDCKNLAGWATKNVKKHQAKHFDYWDRNGGVSCILLRMADKSRWVIPWKILRPFWEQGKTLTITNVLEIGYKWEYTKDESQPNYDWLTPLLRWVEEQKNGNDA
tara:strand:+ start:2789 stop:3319 length:531 start_codon:yes stop_codon:yes gene_type:complete